MAGQSRWGRKVFGWVYCFQLGSMRFQILWINSLNTHCVQAQCNTTVCKRQGGELRRPWKSLCAILSSAGWRSLCCRWCPCMAVVWGWVRSEQREDWAVLLWKWSGVARMSDTKLPSQNQSRIFSSSLVSPVCHYWLHLLILKVTV